MSGVEADYLEQECLYQREGSHITSVYAGDLLGDGTNEIFAGTDNGQVMDFPYRNCRRQWSPVWQYIQKVKDTGDIVDMKIGDFENDGKNELFVAANTREEYLFLMSNDGVFKWADEKAGGLSLSMDIADIDDDDLYEIIIGNEGNSVVAIDGENKIKWKTTLDNPVYSVEALDVNNDGSLEIIALANEYLEAANVYVLNSNGIVIWNYSIDEGIYHASENTISVVDLNNDNKLEIVVATYKKGIIALDHNGNMMWNYPTEKLVNSVHISDLNGDDRPEIIFSSNPYLYLLDSSGNLKSKININGSALIIQANDLENDGFREVVLGTNNMIQVIGWDGVMKGFWSIERDVGTLSMYLLDLDNDGRKEIIAGYGWDGARLDQKYKSGELIVLKVTGAPEVTTTSITVTTTVLETTSTTVTGITSTTTIKLEEEGGADVLLIIMILVILAILVIAVVVFYFMRKKKEEMPEKEEGIIEGIVEERETGEKEEEKATEEEEVPKKEEIPKMGKSKKKKGNE